MNKTLQKIEKEFDEKFTDNSNGWSNVWIYRDAGKTLISGLKSFLISACKEYARSVVPEEDDKIIACDAYDENLDIKIYFDDGWEDCHSLILKNIED